MTKLPSSKPRQQPRGDHRRFARAGGTYDDCHQGVLVHGLAPGPLGQRDSFADIGQSIAAYFDLPAMDYGTDFFN